MEPLELFEDCDECEGTGEVYYSCCGDDMKGSDFEDVDICPTCREHVGGPQTCESCGGTGKIKIQSNPKP